MHTSNPKANERLTGNLNQPSKYLRSVDGHIGSTSLEERKIHGKREITKSPHCAASAAELPQGFDTNIAENGALLSGGQRQRVSIARALLKDAPIVLLDEATASLDPESETRVQEAIARLTQGKTVLVVAHKMRTVLGADHVVVLDGGTVREQGMPHDLLVQDGLFAHLCAIQGV